MHYRAQFLLPSHHQNLLKVSITHIYLTFLLCEQSYSNFIYSQTFCKKSLPNDYNLFLSLRHKHHFHTYAKDTTYTMGKRRHRLRATSLATNMGRQTTHPLRMAHAICNRYRGRRQRDASKLTLPAWRRITAAHTHHHTMLLPRRLMAMENHTATWQSPHPECSAYHSPSFQPTRTMESLPRKHYYLCLLLGRLCLGLYGYRPISAA